MFPDDPAVQVAVVGIITTLITTIGVVIVAVLARFTKKGAEDRDDVEASLRERIELLCDRIADLQYDKSTLRDRLEDVTAESEAKGIIIRRLRDGLSEREEGSE